MKKVKFINEPDVGKLGQYNFHDNQTSPFPFTQSSGLPPRYDKFTDKDLYTLTEDNYINSAIINGNLQYDVGQDSDIQEEPPSSFIRLDSLWVENNGVNHNILDSQVELFMFDNHHHQVVSNGYTNGPIDPATTTSWRALNSIIHGASSGASWNARVVYRNYGKLMEGTNMGEIVPNSYTFYTNLFDEDGQNGRPAPVYVGNDTYNNPPSWDGWGVPDPEQAFNHSNIDTTDTDQMGIFDFNGAQKLYIMVVLEGDADRIIDKPRDNSFYIWEIDITEIGNPNDTEGGFEVKFEFGPGQYSNLQKGTTLDSLTAAWKVRDLKFTISTIKEESSQTYYPSEQYHPITGSVIPKHQIQFGSRFNFDFLNSSPNAELISTDTTNYTPISEVKVSHALFDSDLQSYYKTNNEKFVASAPSQVRLSFPISSQIVFFDGEELIKESEPFYDEFNHLFYVISWNDEEDKYNNWETILNNHPSNVLEL